jgi:hypothetical protein
MKSIIYSLLSVTLLVNSIAHVDAQNWWPKRTGLPSGFGAKTAYGDGNAMITTNANFGGTQVYYTPDTTTPFAASPSSLGSFAQVQSEVVKASNIHFVGGIAGVFKSHDFGHTWSSTGLTGAVYAMYAKNDTLYASVGAGIGAPNMSVDSGNTWNTIGYSGPLATAYVKANGVLYIGSTGGLKYTADNGATWNSVAAPATLGGQNINGLATLNGNVYASCSNGVFKTADNGATWTNVLIDAMTCLKVVDTAIFGGTSLHGIYKADQNGNSWTQINTGLPFTGSATYNTIHNISFNDHFLIANVEGDSVIFVTSLSALGLSTAPPVTSGIATTANRLEVTIAPNPAGNSIAITLSPPTNVSTTIELSDISGRIVKTSNVANAEKVSIDVSDLRNGIYFVRINNGTGQAIRTLTIMK